MRVVRVQASTFEFLKIHIHETSITCVCIYIYTPFTFFTGSLYFLLMFRLTPPTPPSIQLRVYSIMVVIKSIGNYTNQLNRKINNN